MIRFVLWCRFALVLFGFHDAWFGLVLWMCDVVVCKIREICDVDWLGFLFYCCGVAFVLFQVVWFGLISFDVSCLVSIGFVWVL